MARKRTRAGRKFGKVASAAAGGITTSGVELAGNRFGVKFLQNSYITGGITLAGGSLASFVSKEGSYLESYGNGMVGAASARLLETTLWRFGVMNGYSVNGLSRDTLRELGSMADVNGMDFEDTVNGWFEDHEEAEIIDDGELD